MSRTLELSNRAKERTTYHFICRDQIDLKVLKEDAGTNLEVILVDHHNLSDEDIFLSDSVIEVIDHRPQDARWPWPGRKVHLEIVGSCATLVARNFFRKHPEMMDSCLASLLRGKTSRFNRPFMQKFRRTILHCSSIPIVGISTGPILLDTSNFAKKAGRATPTDVEIVEALERIEHLDLDRNETFNEIVKAKSDISALTADDLLIRDLKITAGVPIVGLPILVEVKCI